MTDSLLRALVDLRDRQIQKSRIQFSNRASALERGTDEGSDSKQRETVERWLDVFAALEKQLDSDIKAEVKEYPIFQEMKGVKGVGPMLAAKIISMVDIERAPTISALWRYAGYAVINGERERPTKGERLHYNARLKTTLYLIAGSFLKAGSPYRVFYDRAKENYQVNRPDWTKGHIHNAAMRKMIKMFLSHLWQRWRDIEGLPTSQPYVLDKMEGHQTYYKPAEFGWGD